jgi:putative ABC transport system ATP-binding protein
MRQERIPAPERRSPADSGDAQTRVLEHLGDAIGIDFQPGEPAAAMRRAERDLAGSWETVWQDRLRKGAGEIGLQARDVWLSPAEVVGALRAGQPAVTFRRSEANPHGWMLLLDRRWAQVYRADLDGDGGEWVSIRDLGRELDIDADQRLPWLLCDPVLPSDRVEEDHRHSTPPPRRLLQLVRPDRADLWSIVVFGALVGGLTLAIPVAVQQLVNSVALGGLMQPVVVLALLLFAVLTFAATLSALQAYVAEIVQRRIFVRVVADLASRLPRVRIEAFDRQHGPELVNRFFDVMTVQKLGAILLLDGVALLLQTLIGLLVLSFYHPLMLAFSVVLLAGIAVVVFVFGRGALPTAIAESRSKYAVAGWLEEIARHAPELKTAGAARFVLERADGLAREYLRARATHYRIVFRQLAGALGLQVLASSALLGLGGGLVIVGELTLGQLVASELIVTAIVASFAKLGKHLESFYDLLAAVDKLGHLFDLPLERDDGVVPDIENDGAALAFRNVSFDYGDKRVLQKLDFEVAPGERVALIGASGSGKSTAFDLILGLRSPSSGYVTIDGVDLRELRLEALREHVVRVGTAEILEGTIEDNVRMGRTHVTMRAIRDALDAVGLLDRTLELRDGLRTQLSTDGQPLSHGEAVRVDLARAIAGRPRLILVDETMADLDEHVRRVALDSLFADDAPWTLVVASANEAMAQRCDRVVRIVPPYLQSVSPAAETSAASVTGGA